MLQMKLFFSTVIYLFLNFVNSSAKHFLGVAIATNWPLVARRWMTVFNHPGIYFLIIWINWIGFSKMHAKQKCSKKFCFSHILHHSIENFKAVRNMCALRFLNPFFRSKNWKNSSGVGNRGGTLTLNFKKKVVKV